MQLRSSWFAGAALAMLYSLGGATVAVGQGQEVTKFVSVQDLRDLMARWQKAREAYYGLWYGRSFYVKFDPDASGFLVNEYAKRTIPEAVKDDPQLARAVIQTDALTVLNRSEFVAMIDAQGSVVWFIVKRIDGIVVLLKHVREALRAESCNVIPCPPDRCDQKTCADNAFRRYMNPPRPDLGR